MTDTAVREPALDGATYDIDGGEQLVQRQLAGP